MTCPKCTGLLVQEEMHEQSGRFQGWRCVQCGLRLDPTILQNRVRHQADDGPLECAVGSGSERQSSPPRDQKKRRSVAP